MKVNLHDNRALKVAMTALAGAVMAACGGSSNPTNDLPAGITPVSATVPVLARVTWKWMSSPATTAASSAETSSVSNMCSSMPPASDKNSTGT